MANLIGYDSEIVNLMKEGIIDLIEEWGKAVQLVYPPQLKPCSCSLKPVGQQTHSHSAGGSPIPLSNLANCPMCGGTAYRQEEETEEITLWCHWDFKKDVQLQQQSVFVPGGTVEVTGYIRDLPKVVRANYIIVQLPIVPYVRARFKLDWHPSDPRNLCPNEFFDATLKRIGGDS